MQPCRLLVLAHVFYPEVWREIAELLHNLDGAGFHLRINVVEGRTTAHWRQALCKEFPGSQVHLSPNLGQDVGGTINLLGHVELDHYDLVCKLHTKRSDHHADGPRWRADLLEACLIAPQEVLRIFSERPQVTMLGSARWLSVGNGVNQRECLRLCDRLGIDRHLAVSPWVAGCMFWCRPYVMQRLKDAGLSQAEFKVAYGRDGTLAHAIERIFGALATERGELYWR